MTLPRYGSIKPSGVWSKKRADGVREEKYYPAWEETLFYNRVDYWHCNVAQRSQPGWPDYVVFGQGWLAFVELKARSVITKKVGTLRTEQKRYRESIEAGGGEYRVFTLPDDWRAVDDWLEKKTGRRVNVAWMRR